MHISPALIYQSESGALMDTWLDNYDSQDLTPYFAISEKGWSNENIGMHWLQHVFDRYTKSIADLYRYCLIVDNHNSHVNMRFINYCDQNRILLAILSPHLTHRLQSLNIGLSNLSQNTTVKRLIALLQIFKIL
jgi:hypothetical protein